MRLRGLVLLLLVSACGAQIFFQPRWHTTATVTRDNIGSTSTDAFLGRNTTAATTGQAQWSPAQKLCSNAWDATTGESKQVCWTIEAANQRSVHLGVGREHEGLPNLRIGFKIDGEAWVRFLHMYHDPTGTPGSDSPIPNLFLGIRAGNETMTGQAFGNLGIGYDVLSSLTTSR